MLSWGARRLRIVHRTGFRYEKPVSASYNEARLTPLTTPTQTTLEARVEVSPVTYTSTYWDYWGSQVTSFEVLSPHTELTVVARSTVETDSAQEPTVARGRTAPIRGFRDGNECVTQTERHPALRGGRRAGAGGRWPAPAAR